MFKYIVLALVFTTNVYATHYNTLTAAYIEVTKKVMSNMITNDKCDITDRLGNTNNLGDIVVVVNVMCQGKNSFTQYLMNVYDNVNGNSVITEPIIVGDEYDFKVELVIVTDNGIILRGKQWLKTDAHYDSSLTDHKYILYNHQLK